MIHYDTTCPLCGAAMTIQTWQEGGVIHYDTTCPLCGAAMTIQTWDELVGQHHGSGAHGGHRPPGV